MSGILNNLNIKRLRMQAARREAKRWSARSDFGEGPKVYYGMERLPGRTDKTGGGIIKCLDLAERFPNTLQKPNLLYLVSSALPLDAAETIDAVKDGGGVFVLNQNGVGYPACYPGNWKQINEPLSYAHARADAVVYQSSFCREAAERFLEPRKGHAEVFHNPVDTDCFRCDVHPPLEDGPVLLLAGSHGFPYRVTAALDTLRHLIDDGFACRLVIAGMFRWSDEASAQAEVLRGISGRGLSEQVDVVGPYAQSEAPALFSRAHMLLHTQVNDACPRLVVEAMSCGLPVVYSRSGGTPELVGKEAGAGVDAQADWDEIREPDPAQLSEAVKSLWGRYGPASEAARERAVSHFDVGRWLDRHAELFNDLCRERA